METKRKDEDRSISKGRRVSLGEKFIQFLAALPVLPRSIWKKMLNLYKGFQSGKAFKQMAANVLKHAALRFREKYLNLLSHGGVLILHIWEHFIRNRSPPNPPPQQISCLEDFFCFGHYRHGWGQKYSNRTPSQRFQLAPPDYMMLPCTSTSMHPLANSVITSGSPV